MDGSAKNIKCFALIVSSFVNAICDCPVHHRNAPQGASLCRGVRFTLKILCMARCSDRDPLGDNYFVIPSTRQGAWESRGVILTWGDRPLQGTFLCCGVCLTLKILCMV
jgi:hypothetical protein